MSARDAVGMVPPRGAPDGAAAEIDGRRTGPRLSAYLVAGFGALIAAMATGRPEVAALGAPFLALLGLGLADRDRPEVRGGVRLRTGQAIEGDVIEGVATVDWDGEAEVDVVLAGGRGVEPVEPAGATAWALRAGRGPVTLPFALRARSWGAHDAGALWVRVHRPGSLLVWERKVAPVPGVRVLPSSLRLDRLLKPAEPRAIAGMHLSRFRGHGVDFAELRPYQPGDRLRDVSWATSARLGHPWITVRHPERTGTVLLLLDAVFSDEAWSMEALARTARAAWAVASVHLRAQDRVGLQAQGRTTAWLPPRGGRRARWMLLDELLTVGRAAEDLSRRRRRRPRVSVPADALVVGVSSLRSQTFTPELLRFRRAGHTSVSLVVDIEDLLPPPATRVEGAARRLWLAQRESERHAMERGGVPTALVTPSGGVAQAVVTLRRRLEGLRHPVAPGMALR